jgi:hypothetical protein
MDLLQPARMAIDFCDLNSTYMRQYVLSRSISTNAHYSTSTPNLFKVLILENWPSTYGKRPKNIIKTATWHVRCESRTLCKFTRLYFCRVQHLTPCSSSQRGETVQARDVYKRGASRPLDWPEQVWDNWILFEHIFGDQSTLEAAQEVVDKQRAIVMKKRQRV